MIAPADLAAPHFASMSAPDKPSAAQASMAVIARPAANTSAQDSPKNSRNLASGTASSAGGVIVALDAMA